MSSRYAYDITGYSIDGEAAVIFAGYSTMKYGSGLTGSTESLVGPGLLSLKIDFMIHDTMHKQIIYIGPFTAGLH